MELLADCPVGLEWHDAYPCNVVLVGSWPALPREPKITIGMATVHRCDDVDVLPAAVHGQQAEWVVAGTELDDGAIQRAMACASGVREHTRLAILGHCGDWRRCERWIRRGCRVYLDGGTPPRRALAVLHAARVLEVSAVDRVFVQALRERVIGPAPHLTRRERDVLDLLRRGFRNREIAGALHLSENTIEYHMRHLMTKLSARNRLEVVERATAFGLT